MTWSDNLKLGATLEVSQNHNTTTICSTQVQKVSDALPFAAIFKKGTCGGEVISLFEEKVILLAVHLEKVAAFVEETLLEQQLRINLQLCESIIICS